MKLETMILFLATTICLFIKTSTSEDTTETTYIEESTANPEDQSSNEIINPADEELDSDAYSYYGNYRYSNPYNYNPYRYNGWSNYNNWNGNYGWNRWRRSPQYYRPTSWRSRSQYDHGPYRVYRRGSLKHPRPRELFRKGRVIFVNPHGPRNYARPNNPSG